MASISTNKLDYAPGEIVSITGTDFTSGHAVEFTLINLGADGIQGTADDFTYATWTALVDSNGALLSQWVVQPDALDRSLVLVANEDTDGDGIFGETDEVSASTAFTDSAGSYNLKWYAADPAVNRGPFLPTYDKLTPSELLSLIGSYPVGSATDPYLNAEAYKDPAISSNLDAVPSLAPKDMALGQVVPFFIEITVNGSTAPENGTITISPELLAKTTSGGNFGFDPTKGIIAAFVDRGDPGTSDPGNNATVSNFTWNVLGTGTNNERIHSDITVSGLNDGDKVIVEVWAVLKDTIPSGVTGNVQTSIEGAVTGSNPAGGTKIQVGNQTVPLLQVGEFFSASADLSVIKSDTTTTVTAGDDPDPVLHPGDTFTYTIIAKNNSTSTVANTVVVTDTLDSDLTFVSATGGGTASGNTVTWNLGALTQLETVTLTITVQVKNTITLGAAKELVNNVNITSITSDPNTANNTNSEPTDVQAFNPNFTITKAVFDVVHTSHTDVGNVVDAAGDQIVYRITIDNTGDQDLTGVNVTDLVEGSVATTVTRISGDLNNNNILETTETWVYQTTYTVTQNDINSDGVYLNGIGGIQNTATATTNQVGPKSATAEVPAVDVLQNPSLTIVKSLTNANDAVVDTAGETIEYTIVVDNTGNVDLTGVVLDDTFAGGATRVSGDLNNNNILETDETWTYAADYVVTQADLNAGGTLRNVAGVDTDQTTRQTDDATSTITQTPSIAVDKVADKSVVSAPGVINYQITLDNTGNVDLTGVTVTDAFADANSIAYVSGDSDSDSVLDVNEVWTYGAQHTVTQTEINNGAALVNTATGSGTGGGQTVSDNGTATTTVQRNPSISINKVTVDGSTSGDGLSILTGETISWQYTVTNTGNVTLTNIALNDNQAGVVTSYTGDNNNGKLDVGETWIFTKTGTAGVGAYSNLGTVTGSYSGGTTSASDGSSYFGANPQIAIDKRTYDGTGLTAANVATAFGSAGDGRNILAGEGITWIYAVKKDTTSNVDLSNISVTDSVLGVIPGYLTGDTNNNHKLDGTETWYYTAGGTAVSTGAYSNTGTASGSYTDSAGHTATDTATDASNYFGANPSLTLDKTTKVLPSGTAGDGISVTVGNSIQWIYTVKNTGNVTLTSITVKDDNGTPLNLLDDKTVGTIASLAAGASTTLTLNGTVTAGSYSNIGTASASYSDSATHSKPVSATDASSYFVNGGFVTNSSLCTFDMNSSLAGKQFNLLFTPNFNAAGGDYKLSDSNPGQFYYNLFHSGTAGDVKTFSFEIPAPFVTQGAVPVHVYSGVNITQVNGQACFTPGTEIANFKLSDLQITDLDHDGISEYTFSVVVPTSGFIYANMHLDYGLEKQSGWVKSSPVSGTDNAIDDPNVIGTQQTILDNTAYNFSALLGGSQLTGSGDTINNDNIFKTIKGVGGLFQMDQTGALSPDVDHTAVQGQKIAILKVSDGSLQGTATTDVDGWYFAQFLATGSKTAYQAVWDQNGNGNYAEDIAAGRVKTFDMGGSAGKYADASFTVIDPTGFNPPSDVVIDGYAVGGFYAGLLV